MKAKKPQKREVPMSHQPPVEPPPPAPPPYLVPQPAPLPVPEPTPVPLPEDAAGVLLGSPGTTTGGLILEDAGLTWMATGPVGQGVLVPVVNTYDDVFYLHHDGTHMQAKVIKQNPDGTCNLAVRAEGWASFVVENAGYSEEDSPGCWRLTLFRRVAG